MPKTPLMTFVASDGEVNEVYDHPYNSTALNERGVELAEALIFLGSLNLDADILEVGNVLMHYPDLDDLAESRCIVDRWEEADRVENEDILYYDPARGEKYDAIISISTLEHIGVDDDRSFPAAAFYALAKLRSMLTENGKLFATWPYGWNDALDRLRALGFLGDAEVLRTYHRSDDGTEWIVRNGLVPKPYGATQPWAEAVTIAIFGPVK